MNLPSPVLLATPFFVLLILAEMIWGKHFGKSEYAPSDTAASLFMGLGNTIAGKLLGPFAATAFFAVFEWRLISIPFELWAFVLCFILDDLAYYAVHRAGHRIRWFWAAHVIHHSSQHYNLSTALRQTWTGELTMGFIFALPLMILGFPPEMVFFVRGANLVYQFWIHTEVIDRMPAWFEAVFNTPSHHRVHHSTNPRYLDANYAGVLIIWDRLFGTFVAETADEPCRYGLVHNLGTFNILKIAFHEWMAIARDLKGARSVRDIFGYLFAPPGWSPDGSRLTSDGIRARYAERLARRSSQ